MNTRTIRAYNLREANLRDTIPADDMAAIMWRYGKDCAGAIMLSSANAGFWSSTDNQAYWDEVINILSMEAMA